MRPCLSPGVPLPGAGEDPNRPVQEWRYPLAYVWGGGAEGGDGLADCADPDLAKHWSCQPARRPGCDCYAEWSAQDALTAEPYANRLEYYTRAATGWCGVFCWSGITVTLREGNLDYQIVVTEENGSGTHNNRAYKIPITIWNINDPSGNLPRWITLGIPKGSLSKYQHAPEVDEGPVLEPKFGRWFEQGLFTY